MATIDSKLSGIGYKVDDKDEEYYGILFTERPSPASLGFITSNDNRIPVTVGPFDLEIHQSKGLLNSRHEEGTTGAGMLTPTILSFVFFRRAFPWIRINLADNIPSITVIWRLSIPLAEFFLGNFASPNPLLDSNSTVLELGSGSSGILALTVGTKVKRWIASDIEVISRPLGRNLRENLGEDWTENEGLFTHVAGKNTKGKKKPKSSTPATAGGSIEVAVINWEQTDLRTRSAFKTTSSTGSAEFIKLDMIVCSDCVYNHALIKPLIDTMIEASKLVYQTHGVYPLVLVAHELRAEDVLEAFLTAFAEAFEVWRVKTGSLGERWVKEVGGSALVHVGILKASDSD